MMHLSAPACLLAADPAVAPYAIYLAFSVYLLGIIFISQGVFRCWTGMIPAKWVHWVLLPGTIVSEMAYIFGCLITGGEIHSAKLMSGGGKGEGDDGGGPDPSTQSTDKHKVLGPLVAAFMSIVACGACILLAHSMLGQSVITDFHMGSAKNPSPVALPLSLPGTGRAFWTQIDMQVELLRRMVDTLPDLKWGNWRIPAFMYLAICLAIRLAPGKRPLRATLGAVVVLAAIIGVLGLLWTRFDTLMSDLWPLVTFAWTLVLFLLCVSLIVRGAVGLVRALAGKEGGNG